MKSLITQIGKGIGLGIGISIVAICFVFCLELWETHKIDESYFPAAQGNEPQSPSNTLTDKDEMEKIHGTWSGLSYIKSSNTFYDWTWNFDKEGIYTLNINWHYSDDSTDSETRTGSFWIKDGFFYDLKNDDLYEVVELRSNYLAYRVVKSTGYGAKDSVFVATRQVEIIDDNQSLEVTQLAGASSAPQL